MQAWPLRSFWMGGFEGADHVDARGRALDMARSCGHLDQLDADYARAAALGLFTLRESIGWRLAEPAPGHYALARALAMARCARRHGLQILWTLMHYGTPADLDLFDDRLVPRFAAFARAVAQALAGETEEAPVYTLVNEIGFVAWSASAAGRVDPAGAAGAGADTRHSGYAVKRRLVQATLAATEAVRRVDPRARFLQIEPLVHVVAPADRPELAPLAEQVASYQWQAWDLLAGRAEPGLGGEAGMLDLVGVNHYHSGQWEVGSERRLAWHLRDPRRRGLDQLLAQAWQRYGRPLAVTETSHVGAGRAAWLSEIACEVARARAVGVPVGGICLYPLVDRHDWDDADHWHHSGLWDVGRAPPLARLLHPGYAEMLARWQARLPLPAAPRQRPVLAVFSARPWGLVPHRTQQWMERLAQHLRIRFVEPPAAAPTAQLVRHCPAPDIEVLQPALPEAAAGFAATAPLAALLGPALRTAGAPPGTPAWLATPQALALVRALALRPVVYERRAPAEDADLLRTAPLVLLPGPALARATRVPSARRLCLFGAVDAGRFAPPGLLHEGSEDTEAERLLRGLDGPRLCYCGRLDARLDWELLDALAAAQPHWRLVLVGALALPAGRSLPARPNLHWLGPQPHALLPHLLARMQVCLLPWVLDAATRLRHPPQLLEYLAAHKPVVSVPLPDVCDLYPGLVRCASGPAAFARACARALAGGGAPDRRAQARRSALLAQRGWDQAVQRLLPRLLPTMAPQGRPA